MDDSKTPKLELGEIAQLLGAAPGRQLWLRPALTEGGARRRECRRRLENLLQRIHDDDSANRKLAVGSSSTLPLCSAPIVP